MTNCYGYIYRLAGPPVEDMKAAILERFDYLWESRPTLRYRCTVYDRQPLDYPFAERRAGQRLFELAAPGDHVVFGRCFYGFDNAEDWLATMRRWADINITMHFADLPPETSGDLADLVDNHLADLVRIRRTSSTQEEVDRRDMELLAAKIFKSRQGS